MGVRLVCWGGAGIVFATRFDAGRRWEQVEEQKVQYSRGNSILRLLGFSMGPVDRSYLMA